MRERTGQGAIQNLGVTPEHRDAILRNGISPLHRLSFQSTAYQQLALG